MINENKILIENKKPIEIVSELKNEIPTFEEFMKDYKVDDKVEESYYSEFSHHADIGVLKFYGPGEEWDWLKIPCPVRTCPDAINKVCKDWTHARSSCRSSYTSYMKWSTEARLKCNYCDNPSHIRNWVFKCHRHSDYSPYDGTQFTRAILIAMKARDNISEDFGTKLLEFLEDNPY